jgi:hypothetical protein
MSRVSSNAERLRVAFTVLLHRLDDDPAPLSAAGSLIADVVAAVGEATAAVRRTADGARTDTVTEPDEFALDPPMPPPGILPGYLELRGWSSL